MKVQGKKWRRAAQQAGFTLVEIILVLSLLVIFGAIALPTLEGSFARARLQHAGDVVRTAWAKARLAAMESGQTHFFRAQLQEGQYQIAIYASQAENTSEAALPSRKESSDQNFLHRVGLDENRLPEGVVFSSGRTSSTYAPNTSTAWTDPILFFPDGSTTDASVRLKNEKEWTLSVTLRGFTGVSYVSDISDFEVER